MEESFNKNRCDWLFRGEKFYKRGGLTLTDVKKINRSSQVRGRMQKARQ